MTRMIYLLCTKFEFGGPVFKEFSKPTINFPPSTWLTLYCEIFVWYFIFNNIYFLKISSCDFIDEVIHSRKMTCSIYTYNYNARPIKENLLTESFLHTFLCFLHSDITYDVKASSIFVKFKRLLFRFFETCVGIQAQWNKYFFFIFSNALTSCINNYKRIFFRRLYMGL